jgi:LysM repeat protein
MQWEKKICLRITLRRIVVALLMASIVANLIIVGAVLGADPLQPAPTITSTWTSDSWTATFLVATATAGEATVTQIATNTETPTDTPTNTQTPTNTNPPTATLCVKRVDWPVYWVKRGDWLSSIAAATGSTVRELKEANCLVSDVIIAGQTLYVPRLPLPPTPTDTPRYDTPTGFEILVTMSCDAPSSVSFSVRAYDPDQIVSIAVLMYSGQGNLITETPITWNGIYYSGSTQLSESYSVADIAYYQFRAMDSYGNTTTSPTYRERSSSCVVLQ